VKLRGVDKGGAAAKTGEKTKGSVTTGERGFCRASAGEGKLGGTNEENFADDMGVQGGGGLVRGVEGRYAAEGARRTKEEKLQKQDLTATIGHGKARKTPILCCRKRNKRETDVLVNSRWGQTTP